MRQTADYGNRAMKQANSRDVTASLLTEVCHNVAVEPILQPLSGELLSLRTANSTDNARLDITCDGF